MSKQTVTVAETTTTTPLRPKTRARRAEILRAARELLLEEGEIAIAALSKRSGASVGSLYHHFGSKEGVVKATADAVTERYRASLDEVLRPVPMELKPTVKAVIRHHVTFGRQRPEPARLLHVLHVSPAALLESARPRLDALARRAADRRIIDPVPSALLPTLLLGGVMGAEPGLSDKQVDFLARAAWRSLRARRT
jgi:AcrR family transcriptional regulator